MQIEPLYNLPLVYQINDPADNTTYYPQAVIRDSRSGETLDTVNLALASTRRYSANWQAVKDPTGEGRHIDVTVSVYTDANRTTIADHLPIIIDKYLVKRSSVSFGGGGVDVDYEKIEKMLDTKLSVVKEALIKAFPDLDLSPVLEKITLVRKDIADKEVPTPPTTEEIAKAISLKPVTDRIEQSERTLGEKIDAIEIPEFDISPVNNAAEMIMATAERVDTAADKLEKAVGGIVENLKAILDATREFFGSIGKELDTKRQKMVEAMKLFVENADGAPAKEEKKMGHDRIKRYLR